MSPDQMIIASLHYEVSTVRKGFMGMPLREGAKSVQGTSQDD